MSIIKTITIRKKLESDTLKLGKRARPLLGKKVEIIIKEIIKPKPKEKKWRYLGSVSFGGKADKLNIRDFAHND